MCDVQLRSEILDVVQWQISCGSFDCAQTDQFREATYFGGLNAITDERVGIAAK